MILCDYRMETARADVVGTDKRRAFIEYMSISLLV